jgi:hypothetical protein
VISIPSLALFTSLFTGQMDRPTSIINQETKMNSGKKAHEAKSKWGILL